MLQLTPEALANALAKVDARMSATHERLYPGCHWRERQDAIVVNGWRWFGCGDHAPSTDSGIPSDRSTEAARVALRNTH